MSAVVGASLIYPAAIKAHGGDKFGSSLSVRTLKKCGLSRREVPLPPYINDLLATESGQTCIIIRCALINWRAVCSCIVSSLLLLRPVVYPKGYLQAA